VRKCSDLAAEASELRTRCEQAESVNLELEQQVEELEQMRYRAHY
jgi:hypothetical protein